MGAFTAVVHCVVSVLVTFVACSPRLSVPSAKLRYVVDDAPAQWDKGAVTAGLLSDYLWNQTESYRQAALNTDFIQGLKKGTLHPNDFGRYVLQDGVWLEKVSKAMLRAADRAQYTHGLHIPAYLIGESADYQGLADGIYSDWHITNSSGIAMNGGGMAYANYEYHVADTMDAGYYLICMVPCVKLWPWIGQQIITGSNDTFGVYNDWVNSSFDPTYAGYRKVEVMFEEMYAHGELDMAKALEVFSNCMQGEVDFFKYAA